MPWDFTLVAFDAFCRRAAALPFFSLADYLAASPPEPPFVLLRLDVDYREPHAIEMARIATGHGLRGAFYFRHPFQWDAMHAVAALGHEVGYHFETLDTCRGDFDAAADLFARHVNEIRATGLAITTVAAHGSTPIAPTYRNNLDLLTHDPALLARCDLHGETTLSVDFTRVVYLSDANWRWRRYDAYGQQPGTAARLAAVDPGSMARGLYVNFHPQQWFENPVAMLYFRARNRIGSRLRRAGL